MPENGAIGTAEDAINRGNQFLSRYSYLIIRPVSARREGEGWNVEFDVSVFGPKQIVRLTIDSQTGSITEFTDKGNQ